MKGIPAALREILPLLPASARRFLGFFAALSTALTLLDTLSVGLIALLLAPVLSGSAASLPLIGPIQERDYAWWLLGAGGLMVVRAAANLGLQWHATRRFAAYELSIGAHLFGAYIRAPWTERMKRTSQQLASLSDIGIANLVNGVLFPAVNIPTELVGIVSILLVLIVAQPLSAVITLLYFGSIGAVLYVWLARKALVAGRVNRDYALTMVSLVGEMVAALKEITLRDKAEEVGRQIQAERVHVARSRGHLRFLTAVPKAVTDIALIGGVLLVGGAAWALHGSSAAISAVAIFGLAGFKVLPGLVRMQNYATLAQANVAYVETIAKDIRDAERYLANAEALGRQPLPASPRVLRLESVSFVYPGSTTPAVDDVTLDIRLGSSVALVGPSGSGKSTLVDLILGLLTPTSGTVSIDGVPLEEVLADWRSRVGYVPQDVTLFGGTVAQNVALSWSSDFDVDRVNEAIARAQMAEVVDALPEGIFTRLGERGLSLSGGQRQRLGIARALYVQPLVLVLDEATSALDTATEEAVAGAIRSMHGEVTVLAVAHRLSTIRHSDEVCYLESGRIAARGTFEDVVGNNARFAEQARLSGLA